MRYAMAGIISSRALLRQSGGEVLAETLGHILNRQEEGARMSLKDLQDALRTTDLVETSNEENFYGESCTLTKDANGNVIMKIKINTFGLPINSEVEIPVTLADIDGALSNDLSGYEAIVEPVDLGVNDFDHLPNNLLLGTVYTQVAGALANIKGLQDHNQGLEGRFEGYDRKKLYDGEIDFTAPLQIEDTVERVFTLDDEIRVSLVGSSLRVEAPTKLEHLTVSELNKFAYAIHTASQYLQEQGDATSQLINISVNK
jgi:hypothetical protein